MGLEVVLGFTESCVLVKENMLNLEEETAAGIVKWTHDEMKQILNKTG